MSKKIYAQDGVDVELGDLASKIAGEFCKSTYNNSPIAQVVDMTRGNFRGPRGIDLLDQFRQKGYLLACAPDGIGTKVVLHDCASSWQVAAFDLIAMTSFDLVRWGGVPVYFTSVLDVSSLGENQNDKTFKAVLALYEGSANAGKAVNMIIINGETAELSYTVSSDNLNATLKFNWGGSAQGLFHQDKMILGDSLEPGQAVMVLKENGFRSNGISSVRKAFANKFGDNWFSSETAQPFIKAAAEPSVLYDRFFCSINGWYGDSPYIKVHSLIHLSGGSFESKFGKDILFPLGLSAKLNNLWQAPQIMEQCALWRKMDDRSIYETWNGGQGALAVIDEKDVQTFIEEAAKFGLLAKKGGIINKTISPEVRITSAFSGEEIVFK